MLGGENHVGRPEQSVGSGRENGYFLAVDCEIHFGAFAAPDPVDLQQLDSGWPVETIQLIDEALGVSGDSQHPLAQWASLDGVTFFAPFFDLFIGKHGPQIG